MADKNLVSITFPGLSDRYVVPQVDNTLTQAGRPADAKKTGDEISALKQELNQTNKSIGYSSNFLRLIYSEKLSGVFHVINKTWNTSNAAYKHLDYTLQGERYLYITGNPYSNNYPLWIFLDSNDDVVSYQSYSGGSAYIVDEFVTVPPGATRLIVNGAVWNNCNVSIKTYDYTIRESLESLPSSHVNCDCIDVGTRTEGKAYKIDGTESTGENYEYLTLNLEGGEAVTLSGYNYADNFPGFMIFKDSTIIYVGNFGNAGAGFENVYLRVPDEATKIVVNGYTSHDSFHAAKIKTYGSNVTLNDVYHKIKKRKYLFIGDSYLQGYSHDGMNDGWGVYLAGYLGLTSDDYIRSYKGGARFSYANNNTNTYSALLEDLDVYPDEITDIVVCGGYNDNSYTTANIMNGIINFCSIAKIRYPNARIHVGFIAWNKAGNGEGAIDGWETIHNKLMTIVLPTYQACALWSSYSAQGCSYMNNVEYWVNDDSITDSDGYHPNATGNQVIARAIANALLCGSAPIPYNADLRL